MSDQNKNRQKVFEQMDTEAQNILDQENRIEVDVAFNEKTYLFVLFLIGIINNTGYVLVGTAAQDIAKKFDMENFMSLFQLSLIALSAVVRYINSKYFIKIAHKKRIFVAIIVSIGAFVIIALSSKAQGKWGFFTCLIGSVMCGCMQAFGESVILGYIKIFPPRLVAGWSSGTGFAGPFGSGLLLLLKGVDLDLYIIFLIMIPIEASYWLCFLWYDNKRKKFIKTTITISQSQSAVSESQGDDTIQQLLSKEYQQEDKFDKANTENSEDQDARVNKKFSLKTVKTILPKIWGLALNLCIVYYLEYVVLTGWAERAHPKKNDSEFANTVNGFLEKNGFVILCFCYQIGVFMSRSSLYLIKVEKVIIFTLAQSINFFIWIFFAVNQTVPITVQIPFMIFVGLMGGASYVNINYLLLNSEVIDKSEKELAMNICSIFNDTGVLLSSLSVLIIDNFIMTN